MASLTMASLTKAMAEGEGLSHDGRRQKEGILTATGILTEGRRPEFLPLPEFLPKAGILTEGRNSKAEAPSRYAPPPVFCFPFLFAEGDRGAGGALIQVELSEALLQCPAALRKSLSVDSTSTLRPCVKALRERP